MANAVNVPDTNEAEIAWFGPYTAGTNFTGAYKVAVPPYVPAGNYSFPDGTLLYYLGGEGPYTEDIAGDSEIEVVVGTTITGTTGEAICEILPAVTVTLYENSTQIDQEVSDGSGNYALVAPHTADYNVTASKAGFRNETQWISITDLGGGYTLDFRGETGLIPNAPSAEYAMACVNHWLFPPSPECGLSAEKAMAVVNAWLFPVS